MTITWIASIALGGIIVAFLLTPVLEVTLTRRIVNPLLFASLLLAIAIAFSNGASYATDREVLTVLAIISGILVGLSLFVVAISCARLALGEGHIRSDARDKHPEL